jgi:hypothetical protein
MTLFFFDTLISAEAEVPKEIRNSISDIFKIVFILNLF